jgi:hypothetical protein
VLTLLAVLSSQSGLVPVACSTVLVPSPTLRPTLEWLAGIHECSRPLIRRDIPNVRQYIVVYIGLDHIYWLSLIRSLLGVLWERGIREKVVVASLVVLGGGVAACASRFGSRQQYDDCKQQRQCHDDRKQYC